ncbi:MAG TPA: Calx-beta domain-containing protein [Acidimicrobiales bacterium]|nr:Calx-beta domain-containing protein [Acidimicrobiales bacterium]
MFTVLPFSSPAHALNGVSTISVDSVTVNEGVANGSITFHVTVAPAPSIPTDNISADIKPVEGTARQGADYNNFTAHVSWTAGDNAVKTVTVNNVINDDNIREPNETFGLSIVNTQSASAGQAGQVTINDNESGSIPTIHITQPAAAPEGNANNDRHVQVTLSPASTGTVTINYATSDDTATSDTSKGNPDYTPITTKQLTWAAGNTDPKDIPITIKGDTTPEPDEQFFLNFGSPNNAAVSGDNPAVITLTNDDGTAADVPKLTLENIPDKLEGDTSQTTQTVTVTLAPAATQTVTVNYATSDGTAVATVGSTKGDYETTKGTLTFPQGTTSKTFTVPINGDSIDENDEIYHVTLSGAANATIADPPTKDAKILNDDYGQITTVPQTGGGPHTRVFGATGSDLSQFMAYGTDLTSGLHIGRGDFFKADGTVGSDGVDEIITGPGKFPSGSNLRSVPLVRIFSIDGRFLASFDAYDPGFGGGSYVAAGNLDGDTSNGDELITGAGPGGGPHVRIWRVRAQGDTNAVVPLGGFFAYDPAFGGGARVAAGNVAGDGRDEIVTAPGPGGGPHVRVWSFNASDGSVTPGAGFMAYDPGFTGGVFVAAASGHIVTGAGAGGGPHVRIFDGNGAAQGGGFMAYDPSFTGGVSVALGNLDIDLAPEIVTGAGPGGGPHVRVFHLDGSLPFGTGFFAYAPNFAGGVEVAVSSGSPA